MEEANALDLDRLCTIIESMLLVSSEPLAVDRIRDIVLGEAPGTDPALVDQAATTLVERYADPGRPLGRGFRVDLVADGLQLRTPADSAPFLRRLLAARPPKLTKPAMETLAVIAYRQPVTKPEIESIRGVDVGAVLKALLDRDLIRIIGKSDDLGRPILYGTTKKFLELFGLRSLGALPTLREYHELDEVHQQHVDELYENDQPRISDLAAKAAFLVERRHDADLDALAAAEASVEAAGQRTAAVLSGDAERPTDPPAGDTSEVAAASSAAAARRARVTDGEGDARRGTEATPVEGEPMPTGRPRKSRRAAKGATGEEGAPERPTDPPAPPREASADGAQAGADASAAIDRDADRATVVAPPPDESAPTEDLSPGTDGSPPRADAPPPPRRSKLRKKRGADQETNDE